jgi:hypothetical protein
VAYTTATDVVAYADITPVSAADTALLNTFIAAAKDYIDGFCRQTFEASADSTRYFDPTRDASGRKLYLDAPLIAITTVTNGNGVLVTASQYITEPRNQTPYTSLVLKGNAGIAWTYTDTPENAIAIVGRWAHSLTAPDGIVQIAKELVAYYWRQKESTGDLDRAVLVGNNTILPARIPLDIKEKLTHYRRLAI